MTVYKSEVIHSGLSRDHYSGFYILSTFGLFFFLIALKLKESYRKNLMLIVFSGTACLYGIEIAISTVFLKVSDPSYNFSLTALKNKSGYDFRSEREFYDDMLDVDKNIVP